MGKRKAATAFSTYADPTDPLSSLMEISANWKKILICFGLLLAFCFRLLFGLSSAFWANSDDQLQIYLIGLKYSTTGDWPYFGPDVSAAVQIPGALQGLVVGLPLRLLRFPEAPFLLLNILSFASLCFFAWYCTRRLPTLPQWLVWSWLLTAPWTLSFSTQVVNPSYVLPAAVLFFCAIFETYPFLSCGLISETWANFMMGFALVSIMQLHLSWVILMPYIALSFYFQFKKTGLRAFRSIQWFLVGVIFPAGLLLPTFFKFGLRAGTGNTLDLIGFNSTNLLQHLNLVEGVLGRFLSFASFEIPRFIGRNTTARLEFAKEHPWLLPFLLFLTVVGLLQPLFLFVMWFLKRANDKDWQAIRYLTLGTVVLLYVSFLFTSKAPSSHTFYVALPVAMLYSFYCWTEPLKKKCWRRFALVVLICGIIFDIGLAAHNFPSTSLYVDRARIQRAIDERDYRVVGKRRDGANY